MYKACKGVAAGFICKVYKAYVRCLLGKTPPVMTLD